VTHAAEGVDYTFHKLKHSLHGTKFENDEFLVPAANMWTRNVGPKFSMRVNMHLFQGGERQLRVKKIVWKKLEFVPK
jgi:hypothetical protein